MEKEGFIRTVTSLDDKVGLRAVSTDRHTQIRKLMATEERFIQTCKLDILEPIKATSA